MQVATAAAWGRRTSEQLAILLGVAVFVYLLGFPRVLGQADESVVLYGAKRLLQGQALYKDFFEFITPASFYFFAGLFGLTGPSLLAARIAMAVANSISCVLLFRLVRHVAGVPEAVAAVAIFAVSCLPVWPYASPHWLSTTLCLATASVVLSEPWQRGSSASPMWAGALVGLTFCTHQHRGVFLGLWAIASAAILARSARTGDRWPRCRRETAWMAIGALAAAAPILGYSVWRASLKEVIGAVLFFVVRNYYPFVHGSSLSGKMPWAGVAFLAAGDVPYAWMSVLRSFPAILVLEAVALGWRLRQQWGCAEAVRACCLLLAVMMSLSICYLPDYIHVAFIAPFGLIVAARLVYQLRTLPVWRFPILNLVPALGFAFVLLASGRKGWANMQYAWSLAPERFDSAVGTLYGDASSRQLLRAVQQVLQLSPSQRKTLYSYPADAWLYLAAPADNPSPFAVLVPRYNSPEQFQETIAALQARPPDCVVVNVGMRQEDPVLRSQAGRYKRLNRVGWYDIYVRTDQ
jgi:hypothetical protein